MAQNKNLIAQGGDQGFLHHLTPEKEIQSLIPASIDGPIKLTKHAPIFSADVLRKAAVMGAQVTEVPIPAYGTNSEGKSRRLDNSDCLIGYEPLYGGDLSLLKSINREVADILPKLRQIWGSGTFLARVMASVESQDLDKLTMQRWRPPGWFVHLPFADDIKKSSYDSEFRSALMVVADRYASVQKLPSQSWSSIYDLMATDYDPPDTSTGMPTLESGLRTQPARLATLTALAPPDKLSPSQWLTAFSSLGMRMGLPENYAYASMLATRHGPTRKPVELWIKSTTGYTSQYSSVGLYDRTRFVYPIPHALNFMLSSTYVQLKTSRQAIMGLWHDPPRQKAYIDRLRSQGRHVYTVDFSGMDTTMPPHLISLIADALMEKGFLQWPLTLLKEAISSMSLLMPSFSGHPKSSTAVSKLLGWMSGWKLTSEMDTIFGLTTILTCLENQRPGTIRQWRAGSFIILIQGDDIMFTVDTKLDTDKLSKDAKSIAGASLKVLEDDILFLKRVMPLIPGIPDISRTFARLIQQTFWNEDRYDGIKGGSKPDALMRLALLARCDSIQHHPFFKQAWPLIWPIIEKLHFIQNSNPSFRAAWKSGSFRLDDGDEQAIRLYAAEKDDYLTLLMERAKYEPSAAHVIQMLRDLGIRMEEDFQLKQRRVLLDGLRRVPEPQDFRALSGFMTWLNR